MPAIVQTDRKQNEAVRNFFKIQIKKCSKNNQKADFFDFLLNRGPHVSKLQAYFKSWILGKKGLIIPRPISPQSPTPKKIESMNGLFWHIWSHLVKDNVRPWIIYLICTINILHTNIPLYSNRYRTLEYWISSS